MKTCYELFIYLHMSSSVTCPYCHNLFVSRGNLNRHIKTAQYCLDIRSNAPKVSPKVSPKEKPLTMIRIGGKTVGMRPNKYVNGKQLADALGVKTSDWKDLDLISTQIKEVFENVDVIVDAIWWHPDLAIAFAQSVSSNAWLHISAAQRCC